MNYYLVLEINSNATQDEIKKAHRKLVLKYHPDKNTENNKEQNINKFIQINEAYEVLKDLEKKKVYDYSGLEGLKKYHLSKEKQENVNEAQERNKKKREERNKRKKEKEDKIKKNNEKIKEEKLRIKLIKLKEVEEREKQLAEKRQKEIEEEVKRKEEEVKKKKIIKLKEIEEREKKLAEKRQKEIDDNIRRKNEQEKINYIKINNKNKLFENISMIVNPIKNIVYEIVKIPTMDIIDSDVYIQVNLIDKICEKLIEYDEKNIKELFEKLTKIKEYFENDFNDEMTNKNIRGKLLFNVFIQLSKKYFNDAYIYEKYEEILKERGIYNKTNFYFLDEIVLMYIRIIKILTKNIYNID